MLHTARHMRSPLILACRYIPSHNKAGSNGPILSLGLPVCEILDGTSYGCTHYASELHSWSSSFALPNAISEWLDYNN